MVHIFHSKEQKPYQIHNLSATFHFQMKKHRQETDEEKEKRKNDLFDKTLKFHTVKIPCQMRMKKKKRNIFDSMQ